ncbi:TetR/AcrR family transcriptional regulator [Bacteroides sp. 224]|uniref:TetR/AcrR family transcriptional regulator n=1 Tax=Bacteroides sp. 224 TaxID=2302936 RepID=UPI0013D7C4EF|nr:TetR/AcrR family transcriptional regulator [Bacteroides sp. 224]NDV66602.1 TetR/AcrR family transcriptional regulator [Bacteroides sp. 224]
MDSMSKDKISKVAINLFSHFGIKGVSMSQIAGALQISKKTLYNVFENKEELLSVCLDYEKDRVTKILRKTEKEANSPIELLMLTLTDMFHYNANFCPAFFKDVQRFQEAYDKLVSFRIELHQLYMSYFHKGIEEGYFLPDFEYESIAALLVDQVNNWKNMQQPYIMLAFLRGICTKKGMEELNQFTAITNRKFSN